MGGGGGGGLAQRFGCKGRDEAYLILQRVQDGWGQLLLLHILHEGLGESERMDMPQWG